MGADYCTSRASRSATRPPPSRRAEGHRGRARAHRQALEVRGCRRRASTATGRARRNFYIADNVMIGRNDPDALIGWLNAVAVDRAARLRRERELKSYYAVSIYGAGHVMAYNRVTPLPRRHRSCDLRHAGRLAEHAARSDAGVESTSTTTTSPTCTTTASRPTARCTTSASFEPMLQRRDWRHEPAADLRRPGLFHPQRRLQRRLRSVEDPSRSVRHLRLPEHLRGRGPQLTPASNMHFRNNLILGQGARPACSPSTRTRTTARPTTTVFGARPRHRVCVSVEHAAAGQAGGLRHSARDAALRESRRLLEGDGSGQAQPRGRLRRFRECGGAGFRSTDAAVLSGQVDLRLAPRSRAIDAGIALPGINDGFGGSSADLGRLRAGRRAAALRTA